MKATLIALCLIAAMGVSGADKGGSSDDDGDKKRPFLTTLSSCTGDCRPDKFPRCTGSCVVNGGETLPLARPSEYSLTLSGCTGTCTPQNFPSCDGTCTANTVRIDDDDSSDNDAIGSTGLPHPTLAASACSAGTCTIATFPRCAGTCTVAGIGKAAATGDDSGRRDSWIVGSCTGTCDPDTFPLCDGTCEVTVAAAEKAKGSNKGTLSFKKVSSRDKKKIKESGKKTWKEGKGKGKGKRTL